VEAEAARGVTHTLFHRTMPNTSVQAELQMPSMIDALMAVADRGTSLVFLDIAAVIRVYADRRAPAPPPAATITAGQKA